MNIDSIISKSSKQTEKIGFEFAKKIKAGDVIYLIGDLGAGKTTFVKGLASGLGIKSRIISPTFVVVREHEVEGSIKTLYHLDLYRLADKNQAEKIDLADMLHDKKAVIAIEWPEVAFKLVNKKVWSVHFKIIDEYRKLEFSYE